MKMTLGMKLGIALALWAALVVGMLYTPPAHGAGVPAGAMPGASQHDPGEWYVDANALFRSTVAQLHNAKATPLSKADADSARSRCLTVATEYNKRSAKIKVGGKSPVVKGKDVDGPHNGMRLSEDFFEKRSLPRTLNASECAA